jgi:hypothetical protein
MIILLLFFIHVLILLIFVVLILAHAILGVVVVALVIRIGVSFPISLGSQCKMGDYEIKSRHGKRGDQCDKMNVCGVVMNVIARGVWCVRVACGVCVCCETWCAFYSVPVKDYSEDTLQD